MMERMRVSDLHAFFIYDSTPKKLSTPTQLLVNEVVAGELSLVF